LKSWELYLNKGYQSFENISSVVTTKLKGYEYLDDGIILDENNQLMFRKARIIDTTEIVIPSLSYNNIFIMTNYIKTEQKRDICDEVLVYQIFLNYLIKLMSHILLRSLNIRV